jgi:hypothetical protein
VRDIVRVLDTGAMLAYARQGSPTVSATLLVAADQDYAVGIPVTCVAEAYQQASAEEALMLDLLCALPAVQVLSLEHSDGPTVGGIAKFAGRLGLAHACLITMGERIAVVTAEPEAALKVIGDDQLIWGL